MEEWLHRPSPWRTDRLSGQRCRQWTSELLCEVMTPESVPPPLLRPPCAPHPASPPNPAVYGKERLCYLRTFSLFIIYIELLRGSFSFSALFVSHTHAGACIRKKDYGVGWVTALCRTRCPPKPGPWTEVLTLVSDPGICPWHGRTAMFSVLWVRMPAAR